MGRHHHSVGPGEGVHTQEGQVGAVGSVYEKFSTMGVDHPGNPQNIRQQTGICG